MTLHNMCQRFSRVVSRLLEQKAMSLFCSFLWCAAGEVEVVLGDDEVLADCGRLTSTEGAVQLGLIRKVLGALRVGSG